MTPNDLKHRMCAWLAVEPGLSPVSFAEIYELATARGDQFYLGFCSRFGQDMAELSDYLVDSEGG